MLRHDTSVGRARLRTAAAAACAAVVVALLTVLAPPSVAGTKVDRKFFGLHDATLTPDTSHGVPQARFGSLRLWDTGVTWRELRAPVGHSVLYDFGRLDAQVAAVEAHGVKPMYVFGGTPAEFALEPESAGRLGPGSASVPRLDPLKKFARQLATRYGTRMEYQIWNEPNVPGYFLGTPRDAARITRAISRAIRAVAPKATIVAPSFPLRHASQQRYFRRYWKQKVKRAPVARFVDVASMHAYPLPHQGPEAGAALIGKVQRFFRKQRIRKPLWNTEVNYGLIGNGESVEPLAPETQASYVVRTYLLNAGRGVKRVYWYRWDLKERSLANTVLTQNDGRTPSLAGEAYDRTVDWMKSAKFKNCKLLRKRLWRCTATTRTQVKHFYWTTSGRTRVTLPKRTRWVVDMNGEQARARGGDRIRVTHSVRMVLARK